MLGKSKRDVLPETAQVTRGTTDAEGVGHARSSLHRLAPVALTALGIFGAMLMIFAGLVALNQAVLPFDGWPLNADSQHTRSQIMPRAPAETGRLRTAAGGALARINDGRGVLSTPGSPLLGTAGLQATTLAGIRSVPQRGGSQSAVPSVPMLSRAGVDSDRDGVDNQTEQQLGTNPLVTDSDGDGIPDGWEVDNGLNPTVAADAATDTDGDGLTNQTEFTLKDNPQRRDSNRDGVDDGVDDADQDGVPNAVEQTLTTDPIASDSNNDGTPDGADDPDADGLPTALEVSLGLDPDVANTAPGTPVSTPETEAPAEPVEEPAPTVSKPQSDKPAQKHVKKVTAQPAVEQPAAAQPAPAAVQIAPAPQPAAPQPAAPQASRRHVPPGQAKKRPAPAPAPAAPPAPATPAAPAQPPAVPPGLQGGLGGGHGQGHAYGHSKH